MLNTTFAVNTGDRIGWTNEGTYGPISFQYEEQHRTYFTAINYSNSSNPVFPNEGTSVTFDSTYLPSIFSIAVQLDPGKIYLL